MRIRFGTLTANLTLGVYMTNWGYPIRNEWELGLYLFKWYIGIELFR